MFSLKALFKKVEPKPATHIHISYYNDLQNKFHTVEQLLIISDQQRDAVLAHNDELEKIIKAYQKKLRNANKTIRGN